MSPHASQQLDAIASMMASGQRNLRMERWSLVLWGLAGGLLFLFSESILTPAQLPDLQQRALAWFVLIAFVLAAVGTADWHLTQRAKRARDEVWSFVHRQVLKVLWLLMGIGALLTFAVFFYGGGYMLYTAWLVLLGTGLYVHGLFSEETLEWVGAMIILMGIAMLATQQSAENLKNIATSVFGIGLPALALMLDHGRVRSKTYRALQALGWVCLVLAIPLAVTRWPQSAQMAQNPVLSLQEFQHPLANTSAYSKGGQAINLPAGTAIPVHIEIAGNLFATPATPLVLPLVLKHPMELWMVDGKLTGAARLPGAAWSKGPETRISIPWVKGEITSQAGPLLKANMTVQFLPSAAQ
jgi:hypothetical protein